MRRREYDFLIDIGLVHLKSQNNKCTTIENIKPLDATCIL